MTDKIILDGIQIMASVGISEEERSRPQRIEVSVVLNLDLSDAARSEQLNRSVDYAEVHRRIIEVVQHRPRPLIETVAEDIAQTLLKTFKLKQVEVEVRKFILENTRSVAVCIVREHFSN